jgi:hypothetical protein
MCLDNPNAGSDLPGFKNLTGLYLFMGATQILGNKECGMHSALLKSGQILCLLPI